MTYSCYICGKEGRISVPFTELIYDEMLLELLDHPDCITRWRGQTTPVTTNKTKTHTPHHTTPPRIVIYTHLPAGPGFYADIKS